MSYYVAAYAKVYKIEYIYIFYIGGWEVFYMDADTFVRPI